MGALSEGPSLSPRSFCSAVHDLIIAQETFASPVVPDPVVVPIGFMQHRKQHVLLVVLKGALGFVGLVHVVEDGAKDKIMSAFTSV
eukprot:6377792-Amphidinium_carterae.1